MTRTISVLIFQIFSCSMRRGRSRCSTRRLANCDAALSAPGNRPYRRAGDQFVRRPADGEPFSDDPVDTLIVTGGRGTREASASPETLAFIRVDGCRARRIASVCTGAFILAAAGLLDGRRATTHWGRAAELAGAYPQVHIEPDRIFIRDGQVWTSAGVTAGIDLALALVADDLGEAVAKRAAQQLVVYYRRPGGQSQFSALLEADRPDSRFSPVLAWARERLGERLPVERLADHAAMSPRHFARAFAAETGTTPAKAIERLRLEAAREQVESSAEPIERSPCMPAFRPRTDAPRLPASLRPAAPSASPHCQSRTALS